MDANETLRGPVDRAIRSVLGNWPGLGIGAPEARRVAADVALVDARLALVGVTGRFRGRLVVGFEGGLAAAVAAAMTGDTAPPAALARSALAELANMIAGAAIRDDACAGADITPPTLVGGRSIGVTPLDGEGILLEYAAAAGRLVALIAVARA